MLVVSGIAGRDVSDRSHPSGEMTVMPPLTSVADAHVAVAVDGQRVEQLKAGQPGEADAAGPNGARRRQLARRRDRALQHATGERLGPVQRAIRRATSRCRSVLRSDETCSLMWLPSALA